LHGAVEAVAAVVGAVCSGGRRPQPGCSRHLVTAAAQPAGTPRSSAPATGGSGCSPVSRCRLVPSLSSLSFLVATTCCPWACAQSGGGPWWLALPSRPPPPCCRSFCGESRVGEGRGLPGPSSSWSTSMAQVRRPSAAGPASGAHVVSDTLCGRGRARGGGRAGGEAEARGRRAGGQGAIAQSWRALLPLLAPGCAARTSSDFCRRSMMLGNATLRSLCTISSTATGLWRLPGANTGITSVECTRQRCASLTRRYTWRGEGNVQPVRRLHHCTPSKSCSLPHPARGPPSAAPTHLLVVLLDVVAHLGLQRGREGARGCRGVGGGGERGNPGRVGRRGARTSQVRYTRPMAPWSAGFITSVENR
jgi:hypothetical protein